MGGWSSAAGNNGWRDVRRERAAGLARVPGRWTAPDIAVTVVAFVIHWEIGVAVLGLKLWQQASGYEGSVLSFARTKWDALVAATRSILEGGPRSFTLNMGAGPRSSGNLVFDSWRRAELARIEAERDKLRVAERDFTAYRNELLHAKDRDDFDRFMQARTS